MIFKKIYTKIIYLLQLFENYLFFLAKAKKESVKENAVIFFLPELSISTYRDLYQLIDKKLIEKNIPTYFTRCFNFYDHCLYRDNNGFKKNIKNCLECNSSCINSMQSKKFINLSSFLTRKDKNWINNFLNKKNDSDLLNLEFNGIKVGKLCLSLVLLHNKISNIDFFNEKDYLYFREEIKNYFFNYFVTKKIIHKAKIKNIIVINEYPSLLGIWSALQNTYSKFTVISPTYHKGILSNHAHFVFKNFVKDTHRIEQTWKDLYRFPISPNVIKESFEDIIFKQTGNGTYNYSLKKNINENVKNKIFNSIFKKNIICFTSSEDETPTSINTYEAMGWELPPKNDAFTSQTEWIKEIVCYAHTKEKYHFIIRIHPRMGADHRNKTVAKDLDFYKELALNTPENVKIIWPNDPISSYDLADIADLALISWSTMGTEFSRLGIPVLSGIKSHWDMPDKDFIWFANTKEKYFNLFEELLNKKFSLDEYKLAHRWYGARYLSHGFNMESDKESGDFLSVLLNNIDPLDIYKEHLLKNTEEEERISLSHHIKPLISLMLLGEVLDNFDISFSDKSRDLYIEKIDNYNIYYIYKNKQNHKFSSSAARLLLIYKETQS